MRQTSRESWKEFKGSKAKTNCIKLVMEALSKHGPSTGREICTYSGHDGLWKRLSELSKDGYIEEKGKRPCTITGKKAIVWAVVKKKEEVPKGPITLANLWEEQ